jgi:hypothetical protein
MERMSEMGSNINDVVSSPDAYTFGTAVNELNDTAKRRMFETLQDSTAKIAVGRWVIEDPQTHAVCGCLMFDGVLQDEAYISSQIYFDDYDLTQKGMMNADEDDVLKFLYLFYGYNFDDVITTKDFGDGEEEDIDRTLTNVASRFDTFVRNYGTEFMSELNPNDPHSSPIGLLNDDGRKAVLAVFHKYVTIPPADADSTTE